MRPMITRRERERRALLCPNFSSAVVPCVQPWGRRCPHVPPAPCPPTGLSPCPWAQDQCPSLRCHAEGRGNLSRCHPGGTWGPWGQILHRGWAQVWHSGSVPSPCTGWYHEHQMLIRQLQVIIFHQRKGRPRHREPPGEPSSPLAPPPSPGVTRDPRSPSGSAHLPSPLLNPPPLIAAEAWRASGDCV